MQPVARLIVCSHTVAVTQDLFLAVRCFPASYHTSIAPHSLAILRYTARVYEGDSSDLLPTPLLQPDNLLFSYLDYLLVCLCLSHRCNLLGSNALPNVFST